MYTVQKIIVYLMYVVQIIPGLGRKERRTYITPGPRELIPIVFVVMSSDTLLRTRMQPEVIGS